MTMSRCSSIDIPRWSTGCREPGRSPAARHIAPPTRPGRERNLRGLDPDGLHVEVFLELLEPRLAPITAHLIAANPAISCWSRYWPARSGSTSEGAPAV